MGSHLNFKNFGNDPPADGGGGRPAGSFPLTRQPSVYSLTFDEFQNTVGPTIKDFGSMNMDELIKNIWTAEENNHVALTSGAAAGIERQGSLTLPRTLSHKTVDEIWRNMSKDATAAIGGFGVPQRQPTLGEITIEEFLIRAGVVREETQLPVGGNNLGFFGDLCGNLPGSVNGIRSDNHHLSKPQQQQQQQHQHQHQHQHILPKQPALGYISSVGIPTGTQLANQQLPGGVPGISSAAMSNPLNVHGASLQDVLGTNCVTVAKGSPALSSDGYSKSNGDTSSLSPVPFVFNGALRGRKSATMEKAVERRQRRMIKNRESAARSRARKQAYTMELEAEVAKLKEEQAALQTKQAELIEMQKNQVLEMMKDQNPGKRRCLRRTWTGPW